MGSILEGGTVGLFEIGILYLVLVSDGCSSSASFMKQNRSY